MAGMVSLDVVGTGNSGRGIIPAPADALGQMEGSPAATTRHGQEIPQAGGKPSGVGDENNRGYHAHLFSACSLGFPAEIN